MSNVIEANNRTRLLGLWDEHKELLAEYEELRSALFPAGARLVRLPRGTTYLKWDCDKKVIKTARKQQLIAEGRAI